MMKQMEALFDEQVRPALASHGGDVEIVDIDNNKVFVKLSGGCQGCAASQATLTQGIETLVKQNFPEIEGVVDITDHGSGENPYYT